MGHGSTRGALFSELTTALNVAVKVSSHLLLEAASPDGPAELLDDLLSRFGPDRIMWGSDWPQTPLPDYGAHLELAQRALSHQASEVRQRIMGGTAAAWLGGRFINSVEGRLDSTAGGEP